MTPRKIMVYAVGPMGAAALALITMPFVAWFFTVEDVGRLTMLQVVLSLTGSFFSLAMHQAYVREYHEEKDKPALLKVSLLPGFCILSLLAILTMFLPVSISEYIFGIDFGFLSALLLIGIFSNYFIIFFSHVIRMQERGLAFSLSQIAPRLFLLVFIVLMLIFNLKKEFKYLMLMEVLALLTSLVVLSWLTRDTWILAFRKKIDIALLERMLRFSLPLVFGGLAYWGLTTMDRFFLRSMSGFEELGVYALSVTLAGSVTVISAVFSNIWHPTVYKWINEGVKPYKIQRVIDNMLILVAVIWSGMGAFSWVIPYFFPEEYKAIEYLIVACISMPLLYMLSETTFVGIGITRQTSYAMLASIAAFIINIILNFILIPIYGASGAVLATVVSFFVFLVFRTESSVLLWHPISRFKLYLIVILYTMATTIMVLTKNSIEYFWLVWFVLLILTIILFLDRFFESIAFLKRYFI